MQYRLLYIAAVLLIFSGSPAHAKRSKPKTSKSSIVLWPVDETCARRANGTHRCQVHRFKKPELFFKDPDATCHIICMRSDNQGNDTHLGAINVFGVYNDLNQCQPVNEEGVQHLRQEVSALVPMKELCQQIFAGRFDEQDYVWASGDSFGMSMETDSIIAFEAP